MWTSGERYLDASVNSHLISDSSGAGRMVAFCLWSVVPDKCRGGIQKEFKYLDKNAVLIKVLKWTL
jgi:hypothetical protein